MSVNTYDVRLVLRLNGLTSVGSGLAMLFGAGALAGELGIDRPAAVGLVGLAILLFGLDALVFSVRRRLRRAHVIAFAVADLAFAAGSLAVLVSSPDALTFLGRALVATAAVVVAWFATTQLRGARHLA